MSAASSMYVQLTLWDTVNATSSPASESGPTPSDPLAGATTRRSGQVHALASHSATPAASAEPKTSDTCGLNSSDSSPSAVLASCLANRLRAVTHSLGSTLFKLTWKERVTPSGRSIPALRGTARRTSDSASIGWPTPMRNDGTGSTHCYGKTHDVIFLKLPGAAKLAGWGTPTAQEFKGSPEGELARKMAAVAAGKSIGVSVTALAHQAKLAPWVTPAARDWRSDRGRKTDEEQYGTKGKPLPRLALSTATGPTPNGSTASTASTGQLNPELPRWLQGLPETWGSFAPMGMRSSRPRPRRS